MPELPDVEVFRRRLDAAGVGRRIAGLNAPGPSLLAGDATPQSLGRRVKRRTLVRTRRHGKNLFSELSGDGGWLHWHFGMTGELVPVAPGGVDPEYTRVRLDLDDGGRLAFVCRRMLAGLAWLPDAGAWIDEQGLGPDALDLDAERFRARVRERAGSMKGALMNQAVVAGIGNVYADEALFQARLHPAVGVADLDDGELVSLHAHLVRVLNAAIEGGVRRFPEDFLVPHRREAEPCPRCGTPLTRIQVVGRSTYLCPKEQTPARRS